jgi:hypothetical protein
MTEHEQNLRDLAAIFAMAALLVRNKYDNHPHEQAFNIADAFMAARQAEPIAGGGIAAIKPTRKRKDTE